MNHILQQNINQLEQVLVFFICKIVIENSFKGEIMHENISNGLKFTLKFPKIV